MAYPFNIGSIDTTTTDVEINAQVFRNGSEPLVALSRQERPALAAPYTADPTPLAKLEYGGQAVAKFNAWLDAPVGSKGANNKRKPFIRRTLKRFNRTVQHNRGDCLLVAVAKVSNDFKCTFMSRKGSDSYVHHVGLAANMHHAEATHRVYDLKHARMVSCKKNKEGALSLSHLCGNGSCCRAGHLVIEPKRVNDERTSCHTFYRRCENQDQANLIRHLCPHSPKCFANLYDLNTPYY